MGHTGLACNCGQWAPMVHQRFAREPKPGLLGLSYERGVRTTVEHLGRHLMDARHAEVGSKIPSPRQEGASLTHFGWTPGAEHRGTPVGQTSGDVRPGAEPLVESDGMGEMPRCHR